MCFEVEKKTNIIIIIIILEINILSFIIYIKFSNINILLPHFTET